VNATPHLIGGPLSKSSELLGRGGMAEVRKGTDVRLGSHGRDQAAAHRAGQRFDVPGAFPARGAGLRASLNHPSIVCGL
jgi:hypothetical protein